MNFNQISTKIKNVLVYLMFVLCFFFNSCGGNQSTIVPPSIPENKMVNILAETHVAEAVVQMHNIKERDSIASVLYQKIFEANQTKEADFYQSINFYNKQPIILARMYDSIIVRLETRGKVDFKAEDLKDKMKERDRNFDIDTEK